jgi:hypothetical protein
LLLLLLLLLLPLLLVLLLLTALLKHSSSTPAACKKVKKLTLSWWLSGAVCHKQHSIAADCSVADLAVTLPLHYQVQKLLPTTWCYSPSATTAALLLPLTASPLSLLRASPR